MYCRISEKMDFVIGRTAESLPEKKETEYEPMAAVGDDPAAAVFVLEGA